jgi:hypothetical protein
VGDVGGVLDRRLAWASNDALSKALARTRVPQHFAPRTPDYWAPTHILSLNLDMSACLWRVETGPVRCRRAVPRSSDEKSSAASAAGKRLSVWSAQSSCNCSDHQTFACLCMRGRGRKLVAIQTEACECSWGGASACCSEPCGDLLSPGGRKRLTLRMPDKVSETAAWLSA